MRGNIIDTTKTITIAENPFGDDDENAKGFYIGVSCPLDGRYLMPGIYATREAADAAIAEIFG